MDSFRRLQAFLKFPALWSQNRDDLHSQPPNEEMAIQLQIPCQSLQQPANRTARSTSGIGTRQAKGEHEEFRPPLGATRVRNRASPLSITLGILIVLACVAWVAVVTMVVRGMEKLFFPAVGVGLTWVCIAVCYGMDKYFHHKRSQHHDSFLLEGAVTAAVYSYALAWSQDGPSLESALLAVPPGVTFAMWTISKKIHIQNRLIAS